MSRLGGAKGCGAPLRSRSSLVSMVTCPSVGKDSLLKMVASDEGFGLGRKGQALQLNASGTAIAGVADQCEFNGKVLETSLT